MKATYKFKQYLYERGFEEHSCDVEIVSETAKQYKIKLLAPNVNGHQWGDLIWVRKSSVVTPPPQVDCSNQWWQNI